MSEPTKAARRAAGKIHRSKEEHTDRSLAMIIDRETALPELVAALRALANHVEFDMGTTCDNPYLQQAAEALRKAGEL